MTNDNKRLIAEAREECPDPDEDDYPSTLIKRLADALEAASVERAVVEAQALEQAADLCAQIEADTEYDGPREKDISYAVIVLRARADEVRQTGSA